MFRSEVEKSSVGNIQITADAEFRLWVNGQFVGLGPSRGFSKLLEVSQFDLSPYLVDGQNCIAILGHSIGVSTFKYLLGDACIGIAGVDDVHWKCEEWDCDQEIRICCQMGWQEPAGLAGFHDWKEVGFDDSTWQFAEAVEPRESRLTAVQVETVDFVEAKQVERRAVRPPATTWAVSLRKALLPGKTDAEPAHISGLVAVMFHVKQSGLVKFELPAPWFWVQATGKLNGTPLEKVASSHSKFKNGLALEGHAVAGENWLVLDVSGHFHEWTLQLTVDEVELELVSPFLVAGPLEDSAKEELFESDLETWLTHPLVTALRTSSPLVSTSDAFQQTAFAKPAAKGVSQRILDFGRMTCGLWEFEVEADSDGVLLLNGFESIQDGELDFCWEMANSLIVPFREGNTSVQSVLRRGAKYVLVQGQAEVRNFRVREVLRGAQPSSGFECSDDLLNSIMKASERTLSLCSEDTFVDCPTYEQTFWVGDARNEALIDYYLTGDFGFAKRMWLLAAESQHRSGVVESHVPSGWPMVIPAWSALWAMACWEHYQYTADIEFLRNVYGALQGQLRYFEQKLVHNLLSIEAWNLCEWSDMDQPGIGVVSHNQAWLCLSLEATACCAEALGDAKSAAQFRSIRDSIAEACRSTLWNESKQLFTDCVRHDTGEHSPVFSKQTQIMFELAGIPNQVQSDRLKKIILGEEIVDGLVQIGTPFFCFFYFELLEKWGEHEKILDETRSKWGMMVELGATTCWEVFPGVMPGGRWTRSHCHAWSAAPAYFLLRNQLGIVLNGTPINHIRFEPKPCGLKSCSGMVPTPMGPVRASWKIEDGKFTHELTVPEGMSFEVVIPEL